MVRYVIVRLIYCLALSCVVVGCDNPSNAPVEPTFLHDVPGDILPWTKETFDATAEKFTFAVHSDLTGGEREGIYEIAIAQLNLLRPEFIINVGDLIEGDSDEAIVDQQWDSFNERAGKATAPVIYVPGNHDRTGQLMQEIWDRRVGPGYFHFRYKDVLFLVLDTDRR